MTKHFCLLALQEQRLVSHFPVRLQILKHLAGCLYCNCITTAQEMVVAVVAMVVVMVVVVLVVVGVGVMMAVLVVVVVVVMMMVVMMVVVMMVVVMMVVVTGEVVVVLAVVAVVMVMIVVQCVIPRGISDTTRLFICGKFKFMHKYCSGFYVKIQTIPQSSTFFYIW